MPFLFPTSLAGHMPEDCSSYYDASACNDVSGCEWTNDYSIDGGSEAWCVPTSIAKLAKKSSKE